VEPRTHITGILLLDKPLGLSSNGALQRVRRLLRAHKAGHVGSLDPLATGMLPICLGEATKIAGDVLAGRKRYRFTISLGARTTTGDVEGPVIETGPVPAIDRAMLDAALSRFMGCTLQVPPMYSAIKRDGQPLYRLARAGMEVERAPRQIEITEFAVLSLSEARVELEVSSSKGTYIRTLAEDISKALGTCGHVAALRRLYVEPFEDERMYTLDAVAELSERGEVPGLLAPDRAVQHLPAVCLSAAATARVVHGQAVSAPVERPVGRVRLYDGNGRFFGLGEADDAGQVWPRRLFLEEAP
jgi:tRNA pseudouridine55 synthase